jgi:hypothetical protein
MLAELSLRPGGGLGERFVNFGVLVVHRGSDRSKTIFDLVEATALVQLGGLNFSYSGVQ